MNKRTQIQSMTGFGRGMAESDGLRIVVELRSVNGRFLDVRVRMARPWAALEARVREQIAKTFGRGTVDISISFERFGGASAARVNKELATAYAQEIRGLAREIGVDSHVTALALMKLPGVLQEGLSSVDDERTLEMALRALETALGDAEKMRAVEGARVLAALERELAELERAKKKVVVEREVLNAEAVERLGARIKKILGEHGVPLDPTRLAQEAAVYLERSDVTEELDRLRSHIAQFRHDMAATRPLGKRLDFLAQEISREVNTLGAKSSRISIIREVMEMKLALDRIKEQIQNLE